MTVLDDQAVRRGRDWLKTTARTVGVATAAARPLPDFLVIGAKRGGTTSFYFDLIEHPAIVRLYPPPFPGLKPDATKGVHYFDSNFDKSENWYRSYMPTTLTRSVHRISSGSRVVTGEASPYYLFHPLAAERAHATVPKAKILVLLRDPVERTYSHWKERRRSNAEELDFQAALEAEPGRLAGERERLVREPGYQSYAWEQQSYATQSMYGPTLEVWRAKFGSAQVKVIASENYYQDPLGTLREVDAFLDLPPRGRSSGQIRNAAQGAGISAGLRSQLVERFADSNRYLRNNVGSALPWL